MKKILVTILSFGILTTLTGCFDKSGIDVNNFTESTTTTSSADEFVDNTLNSNTIYENVIVDFASLGPQYQEFLDVPVDIDVLNLNDIMAFAQVYNMMECYDEYLGQSVKIHGNYYRHDIPEMEVSYHFLLLIDGTNCCTGIMEFLMPEGMEYPDSGTNLLMMGEYSKYTDDFGTYPCIIVSEYLTY